MSEHKNKYKVELNLYEEDLKDVCKKAGICGMTISELLESFIGDLIDGKCRNGSDEYFMANAWFDRCGFPYGVEHTFLRYLLEEDLLDEFLSNLDDIESEEQDIKASKENLEKGYMVNHEGVIYTWKDVTDYDGNAAYSSLEEWEESEREMIEACQEDIEYYQQENADTWKEYLRYIKSFNKNNTADGNHEAADDYEKAVEEIKGYRNYINGLAADPQRGNT
jgi:uncharacterized protein YifE (UPF0438 family)